MTVVVANMVVRNEGGNYLSDVLRRLATQVDSICITDDASDDNTVAVIYRIADEVDIPIHVNVRMEPLFTTNEGKLRQASWEFFESCLNSTEDVYCLAIDADEMLYETRQLIRDVVDDDVYQVFNVEFYHMWNDDQFRIDKAWTPHPSSRLFKYYPGGAFMERELACGSEPTYVPRLIRSGLYMRDTGLLMKHLSYIKDEDKQAKYERYAKIDGGAFHANAHIESILDPNPVLRDWMWE